MNNKQLNLLAFDMGASNGRAILGKYDGEKLDLEVLHKFPNGPVWIHGRMFWDVLGLLREVKTGLQIAVNEKVEKIDSTGIDTWGVDYGLLDKDDNLLANPYHYRDDRTDGLMDEVFAKVGKETVYNQTGIQFIWFNTLYQLYADVKYRPWIMDNAETLLFMPDLLNYFLTGEKYNEYTISSTSQIFNPITEDWAGEILEELGITDDIMQELIYPGNKIGNITEEVKEECGLKNDVPVIAVGSHDTASAVAATPLKDSENSIYISSGTWSLLGMELDKPVINKDSLAENFTNECGVKRKIRFLKNISGLWLIQECKRSWARQGMDLTYDEIDEAAHKAEPFKFKIDPNDDRFKNPSDMPEAIKEYCRETDQYVPQSYGEMARGIYESLAASYDSVIGSLEGLVNKDVETIHMVGGGIQAGILCQYTANATGCKVITGPVEATAIGNMLAQLMALGEINSLEEGREIVEKSIELKEYTPQ